MVRFKRNQNIFKMITCLRIRISTNLFNAHHTVTTDIQRFFKVVQTPTPNSASNRKKCRASSCSNLITAIESVSKYQLAIIVKKLLEANQRLKIVYVNYFTF